MTAPPPHPHQPPPFTAAQLHTGVPSPARVYDAWTGGRDNYPVDRDLAHRVAAVAPQMPDTARANRAFLHRAVHAAVLQHQISQLLDVGCGIPGPGDAASTARALDPRTRVVAADLDPIAVTRARALLGGTGVDRLTAAVRADLCDPRALLEHPETRRVLDPGRPVALVLAAVLHFVPDHRDPAGIMRILYDAVAPGSLLVFSHAAADLDPDAAARAAEVYNRDAATPITLRTARELAALLDGWRLVEPGLVPLTAWRPHPQAAPAPGPVLGYGAVAVKPRTSAAIGPPAASAARRGTPPAGRRRAPAHCGGHSTVLVGAPPARHARPAARAAMAGRPREAAR